MFRKWRIKRLGKGATMIEYSLIASLIAIATMGGYKVLGNSYRAVHTKITDAIANAGN